MGIRMTEALNKAQLSFLRRAAAAGHVTVEAGEERTILNELIEKKLILGNRLTESGWSELRKARGSLEGLIPFASRKLIKLGAFEVRGCVQTGVCAGLPR
jgi:hypothetical protein